MDDKYLKLLLLLDKLNMFVLLQLWESKLQSSKAVELVSSEQEQLLTRVHKSRQQIQPAVAGATSSSTPAVRAVQGWSRVVRK